MVMGGLHDIGLHYTRTLYEWRQCFHDNWDELQSLGYEEDFKRLWHNYLCYCEGTFLERVISTVHPTAASQTQFGKSGMIARPRGPGPEKQTFLFDYCNIIN